MLTGAQPSCFVQQQVNTHKQSFNAQACGAQVASEVSTQTGLSNLLFATGPLRVVFDPALESEFGKVSLVIAGQSWCFSALPHSHHFPFISNVAPLTKYPKVPPGRALRMNCTSRDFASDHSAGSSTIVFSFS